MSVIPITRMPHSMPNLADDHLPTRGTSLTPVEKLRKLTPYELYPHLGEFYSSSRTFKHYWDMAAETERSGAQASWNTLADNVCMLSQSFRHFVENDWIWFHERCPNISHSTFEKICHAAQKIYSDKEKNLLFHLMIYTRDFGWVVTKSEQGHQKASDPLLHYILAELKFNSTQITEIKNWIEQHSMPAETYLGEVSPRSARHLTYTFTKEVPSADMLSLLSLLEVNCIRKEVSALYQENTSAILAYADLHNHDLFISWIQDQRLLRLCAAKMCHAKTTPSEHKEVEEASQKRLIQINWILDRLGPDDKIRMQRFLEEVDLHYVAATFPKMKITSVARFLILSARKCIPDISAPTHHFHVLNQNHSLFKELDQILSSEQNDYEIQKNTLKVDDGTVIWDLNKESF